MVHLLIIIIYLSFISLGLPDGLLGAAWPIMYMEYDVSISYMGIVTTIIALGTVVSSLQSDRMTYKLGTGKVTALSVALTAVALFGFSTCTSFWMLCIWAVPYGLGAGAVDASLNNYVALHYSSRAMSWLHCMWGVGASVGPYIMAYALTGGKGWDTGYIYVCFIQLVLTAVLFISLPLWKKRPTVVTEDGTEKQAEPLPLSDVVRITGAKEVMIAFFCYCALEQTAGLWASSYLVLFRGIEEETAASFASLFYLGITIGRAASGFITAKLSDTQMIRLGESIILVGIISMFLPLGEAFSLIGLILIGLGCAPIYPCIIHSTPSIFGADKSQAVIGVQMASAYIGICFMPPIFGLIANYINVALLPAFLLAILVLMWAMYERLLKVTFSTKIR